MDLAVESGQMIVVGSGSGCLIKQVHFLIMLFLILFDQAGLHCLLLLLKLSAFLNELLIFSPYFALFSRFFYFFFCNFLLRLLYFFFCFYPEPISPRLQHFALVFPFVGNQGLEFLSIDYSFSSGVYFRSRLQAPVNFFLIVNSVLPEIIYSGLQKHYFVLLLVCLINYCIYFGVLWNLNLLCCTCLALLFLRAPICNEEMMGLFWIDER